MRQDNRIGIETEDGQTMAEYVVVLGVITLAIVMSFGAMSVAIENVLTSVIKLF